MAQTQMVDEGCGGRDGGSYTARGPISARREGNVADAPRQGVRHPFHLDM